MKITIYALPHFRCEFTEDQLGVLARLSNLHYDGTCQAASRIGGFIYGWLVGYKAYLTYREEGESFYVYAKFRELDLCCKILEGSHFLRDDRDGLTVASDLAWALRKALIKSRDLNGIKLECAE